MAEFDTACLRFQDAPLLASLHSSCIPLQAAWLFLRSRWSSIPLVHVITTGDDLRCLPYHFIRSSPCGGESVLAVVKSYSLQQAVCVLSCCTGSAEPRFALTVEFDTTGRSFLPAFPRWRREGRPMHFSSNSRPVWHEAVSRAADKSYFYSTLALASLNLSI